MVIQLSDGKYLHTAYAISNIAEELTADDWSLTDQEGMLYIGTYIDGNSVDSTDPTSYSWEELVDEDVDDEDSEGIMPVADFQSQIDALADQIGIQQSTTEGLQESLDNANQNLSSSTELANNAQQIAGNTNQYFWHTESGTDTGAHITEIPQEQFLEDPENGGGNLLARSNGIAVRDGLEELSTFSADGVVIGKDGESRFSIENDGFSGVNSDEVTTFEVRTSGNSMQQGKRLLPDRRLVSGEPSDFVFTGTLDSPQTLSITFSSGPMRSASMTITVGTPSTQEVELASPVTRLTLEYDGDKTLTITDNSSAYDVTIVSIRYAIIVDAPYTTIGDRVGNKGGFSTTMGQGLCASHNFQTVVGKYNYSDGNGDSNSEVFIVGGGTESTGKDVFSVSEVGGVASLVNTGSSGATFRTTTEEDTVRIRGGNRTDSYASVTIAHTLSGYYPIALIGYTFTGSHATWLNVYKVTLDSQSVGSCNAIIGVRDFTDSTSYVTPTISTTVLWAKSV